jgi:hypothetical protein
MEMICRIFCHDLANGVMRQIYGSLYLGIGEGTRRPSGKILEKKASYKVDIRILIFKEGSVK